MSAAPGTENPITQKKLSWDAYNALVTQIRNKYYSDQQAARAARDAAIQDAQTKYQETLTNLQVKYESDIADARSAFTKAAGT
jgi:hypothetical protein